MLPLPEAPTEIDVDLGKLNWFVSTERFLAGRKVRLARMIDALNALEAGEPLTQKVIATRYTDGLPSVDADRRKRLLGFLSRFVAPTDAEHPSLAVSNGRYAVVPCRRDLSENQGSCKQTVRTCLRNAPTAPTQDLP